MAKYGTILILYNRSDTDMQSAEAILNGHQITFLTKESSIFFKTLSKRNRDEISAQLDNLGLTFVLYHNNNNDGDRIKVGNISNTEREEIKEYITED